MALQIPTGRSTPSGSTPQTHHVGPNKNGLVTDRELTHEVMADLRRKGVSEHDRKIIEAATSGYRDKNGFGSRGIDSREKQELIKTLEQERRGLGLSQTDVRKVDAALDDALEN